MGAAGNNGNCHRNKGNWLRFFGQLQRDAKLGLFCVAALQLFRLVFILAFRDRIAHPGAWGNAVSAALNGLRFDARIAACWLAVPLLFTIACAFRDWEKLAGRVRLAFATAFLGLTGLLGSVTLGYFKEYDDNFNHWLFNLYYDDPGAIMTTVWKEYHFVWAMLGILAVSVAGGFGLRWYLRKPFLADEKAEKLFGTNARRAAVGVIALALLIVAARGSAGRRPAQLKDAGITRDEFLNKTVLNPFAALHYAWSAWRQLQTSDSLAAWLPGGDLRRAARLATGKAEDLADLDAYLLRRAPGSRHGPPRHVFLVVMESYDAWPLLDKYKSLGVTGRVKALGAEGLCVRDFLPASDGTMTTLSAIITGLPFAGAHINYAPNSRAPYPSSLPAAFRQLGYRTRFFYSGYLSWQRTGDFCRAQGFEEVYGGAHMGGWATTNEWGVNDEALYDFVAKTVTDDRPSFNMLMTASNHPPYSVDVAARGFSLKSIPEDIKPYWDGSLQTRVLEHLWYTDGSVDRFVRRLAVERQPALFALTGDHFGRRFLNAKPDYFEKSAVPLVLYGRETLANLALPPGAVGSHLDIGPTLLELCAPDGFEYRAMGRSVLAPREPRIGIGSGRIITPEAIISVSDGRAHQLPGRPEPRISKEEIEAARELHNAVMAVGWWRVMRGAEFPTGTGSLTTKTPRHQEQQK